MVLTSIQCPSTSSSSSIQIQLPLRNPQHKQQPGHHLHFPNIIIKQNPIPIRPNKHHRIPIEPNKVNHLIIKPETEHHNPSKPNLVNHIPVNLIGEHLFPVKPNRENHIPVKPNRENHIPAKPNRENHIKIKPKKAKRSSITTTSTDILCLMDSLKLPIPTDIYTSLIKECTITRNATLAVELHAHINRCKLRLSLPLRNRILLMYVSCGCLQLSRKLFDEMSDLDFNSWAIIISGYINKGDYQEALYLFDDMLHRHYIIVTEFHVSSWIIVWILKACVCTMNVRLGKQIHGLLIKIGSDKNLYLGSSLISFYGKFDLIEEANSVFGQMSQHDTVSWTANIVNNCNKERFNEVVEMYNEMQKVGIKINSFTVSSVLRACGRLKDDNDRKCGRQVHGSAIKLGIESSSVFVKCGLVDMYGKCGLIRDARGVFDTIAKNEKNEACWNAMLKGYIDHGLGVEAVKLLCEMKRVGIEPQQSLINEVRITCGSK